MYIILLALKYDTSKTVAVGYNSKNIVFEMKSVSAYAAVMISLLPMLIQYARLCLNFLIFCMPLVAGYAGTFMRPLLRPYLHTLFNQINYLI